MEVTKCDVIPDMQYDMLSLLCTGISNM